MVHGNRIYNVGEGIDHFGSYCSIEGNVIDKCYIFGIKLIHGAQYNSVTGNTIRRAGLAGINLSGSNTGQDVKGNSVTGNTIATIDPDGVWSASASAGIRTTGSGETYKWKDNIVGSNTIDPGANGKYAIDLRSDGTGNSYPNNRILASGASGRYNVAGTETYSLSDAFPTRVRVALVASAQTIVTATATKIQFESEGADSRAEYDNATNFRWICQAPGRYRVHAQTRFATMADGVLVSIEIRKNGTATAIHSTHNGAANDECYQVTDVVSCVAGDYIEAFVTHAAGADRDITNSAVRTFMTIDPA